MRFAIVWFLSLLLLLPSLVSSRSYMHGDVVRYQGSYGPDHGLVVGSSGGNLHIAPLAHDSPHPANGHGVIAHSDRIVEAHPNHVVATGYTDHDTANHIANGHRHDPPDILEGGGPLHPRSSEIRPKIFIRANHGDIVRYQAPHHGLVVGSSGDNLHIAPLAQGSPHPANGHSVIAHSDRIVQAHPSHVVPTGYSDRDTANHIADRHRHYPPGVAEGGGPFHRRSSEMRPKIFIRANHGDIVHYQASHGRDNGLVVGSSGGNLHIAPLANDSPHPASGYGVMAHTDRIVEAHPSHVVATGYTDHDTANHIANAHRHDPPDILEGGGPMQCNGHC